MVGKARMGAGCLADRTVSKEKRKGNRNERNKVSRTLTRKKEVWK
jgi:hypothetical protein